MHAGDFTKFELGFLSPSIERTVAEVLLSRMASNLMALMQLTQQSPNKVGHLPPADILVKRAPFGCCGYGL